MENPSFSAYHVNLSQSHMSHIQPSAGWMVILLGGSYYNYDAEDGPPAVSDVSVTINKIAHDVNGSVTFLPGRKQKSTASLLLHHTQAAHRTTPLSGMPPG